VRSSASSSRVGCSCSSRLRTKDRRRAASRAREPRTAHLSPARLRYPERRAGADRPRRGRGPGGASPGPPRVLSPGHQFQSALAAIAVLAAVPFITYALSMAADARELVAPPHHIQRLATMVAMAIAVVLTGLLAAFQTRGWRILARCAGTAAMGSASLPWSSPPTGDPRVAGGGHWHSEVACCSSPSLRGGPGGNVETRLPGLERAHGRIRCPKGAWGVRTPFVPF
jgi:hypothetical protein